MRAVARPAFGAKQTYAQCISRVRNGDLKARLEGIMDNVVEAGTQYSIHAQDGALHRVTRSDTIGGVVTKKEIVNVYDGRMARKGSPGRSIYDAIKALPEFGICPLCYHGTVSTLDHVLPKSLFSILSVTPDNLVGACRDCNANKLSIAPTGPENAPLHPYFDDVSGERWLMGCVIEGAVAAVAFHVIYVRSWSGELNARVKSHFDTLRLASLYGSQAAQVISGQRENLLQVFNAEGEFGVRKELRQQLRSWEVYDVNCWQAVTYRALLESKWYCRKGFGYQ